MPKIILSTLNARFSHTSLGLRYLYANMKELQNMCAIKEFVIHKNNQEIAQKILEYDPNIVGFGVYIWNAQDIKEIVDTIKAVSPKTTIILGGPEVSYEPLRVDFGRADYIISGEADELFYTLCRDIMDGKRPGKRLHRAKGVDLKKIMLPYCYYSDFDLQNRYLYIESSRGCPFSCEFCLSSIDTCVRYFDFDVLLQELQTLWQRGARDFKFVDRTFNCNIKKAAILIDFFQNKKEPYFLHFEFIPDAFAHRLKDRLQKFPPHSLQLEIGIQTLDESVAKNISRVMDRKKVEQNLHFLRTKTTAHLHLDLLIGLPGQTLQSFGKDLNDLMAQSSCEIQLGILKKLSGTALARHDKTHKMVYANKPPYDILATGTIDFLTMQKLKRFARYWDIVYNSGNFKQSVTLLWEDGDVFEGFWGFTDYFYQNTQSTHQIGIERVVKYLFTYLTTKKGKDKKEVATLLANDLGKIKGRKIPPFLKPYCDAQQKQQIVNDASKKRQIKHL